MERAEKSGGSEEPPLGVANGTGYSLLLSQKEVPLLLEKGKKSLKQDARDGEKKFFYEVPLECEKHHRSYEQRESHKEDLFVS